MPLDRIFRATRSDIPNKDRYILCPCDDLYALRNDTSDSELIFYLIVAAGLQDPFAAMQIMWRQVCEANTAYEVNRPVRFTAALTDGTTVYAARMPNDGHSPSLYYQTTDSVLLIASEPLDEQPDGWERIPENRVLIGLAGRVEKLRTFTDAASTPSALAGTRRQHSLRIS